MNDYAIVVGINRYPGLEDLEGPENDALAFAGWLTDPTGGDIPPDRVKVLTTSGAFEAGSDVVDAEPSVKVEREFDRLRRKSKEQDDAGGGRLLGRRLYIFLAGHGFAPSAPGFPNFDERALLFANADSENLRHHIGGKVYANWFLKAGVFSEVVLLMDCCSENYGSATLNPVVFGDITAIEADAAQNTFYGFATKWSRVSRGKELGEGAEKKVRGLFTYALIEGLRGAAAEHGEVTDVALRRYVYNRIASLLSDAEKTERGAQEPEFYPDRSPTARFVLAKATPSLFTRRLKFAETDKGAKVKVRRTGGGKVELIAQTVVAEPVWEVQLPFGMFLVDIGDRDAVIEVPGEGKTDVEL